MKFQPACRRIGSGVRRFQCSSVSAARLPIRAALAGELEEVEQGLDSLPDRLRQQNPETTLKDIEGILELRLNRRTELYKLQADQARLVMALSTKLRLTPQSRYQPITAGRKMFDRNQQPLRCPGMMTEEGSAPGARG